MLTKISFRRAHVSDTAFLKTLYGDSHNWESQLSHWPDEARDNFISQQFQAQRTAYKSTFPDADHSIVQFDQDDIGRLIVNRTDALIRIIDLALLSSHQRRGIGGDILTSILREAENLMVPVELSVEQTNPAQNLYSRLGFQETGISGVHIAMEWSPNSRACKI